MTFRRSVLISFLACINLFSVTAAAQDDMGIGLTYTLDSIPYSSLESPSFFKTTVHPQTDKSFKTTDEMISQTTGVDVDNFGGLGTLSTVSIRGSTSNQVNILLNGIKLNSPSNQSVDISSLPLSHASQIEITRGGSSAEYGDGGIGGTINIITGLREGSSTVFGINAGSFGTTSLSFSRNKASGKTSYLISSTFLGSKGDFKFNNINSTPNNLNDDYSDSRQNNSFNSYGLFASSSFKLTERLRISSANEFYYSKKGIPGNVYFPSLRSSEADLRDVMTFDIGLKGLFKNTDLKITLSSKIDRLDFKDPDGELTGTALFTGQTGFDLGTDLLFDIYPGRDNLFTVSLGSTYYGLFQSVNGTSIEPHRVYTHFYLKDQIGFLNSKLMIIPMLRLDSILDSWTTTDHDLVFNPKLGILANPLRGLEIKSNAGSSYRYPSFKELYFDEGFIEGNPDLEKEAAFNFDIGFRYSLKFLHVEMVYFLNRVSNIIVYEQVSNFRYKPLNIGEALIQGIEFSGSINPFSFMKLSVNSSLLDPKNRSKDPNKNGNLIPGRPRHKTNARLSVFDRAREIWAEFQAIGSNYVNEANTVMLVPRYILNMGLSYRLQKATFNIEAKNITGSQIEDVRGFPLPGISFMGGVAVEL